MTLRFRKKASATNGFEGGLATLSPIPLLFISFYHNITSWEIACFLLASILCCVCALTLLHKLNISKFTGAIAAIALYLGALRHIAANPFIALFSSIALLFILFRLVDFCPATLPGRKIYRRQHLLRQLKWSLACLPICVFATMLVADGKVNPAILSLVLSTTLSSIILYTWALSTKKKLYGLLPGITALVYLACLSLGEPLYIYVVTVFFSAITFFILPRPPALTKNRERPWSILLNNPARLLLGTFFFLCFSATMLLTLPAASATGPLDLIDAAFTAVSAVCVTGLIVLDTPHDFSFFGQAIILFFIQLGGLGIMGTATIAMHVAGKRISLKHERMLASLTDTDHDNLVASLLTIIKITILIELAGWTLLTLLFYSNGDPGSIALWRGLFTSISAFCNAGFALQTDSLIQYQDHPLILHTVATLIVIGGMAPATSMFLPAWLRGKTIPIPARIALITTFSLLFSGMLMILSFEWNGILHDLSFGDKLHNAWLQSATLRTAGFNSVDVSTIAGPTFITMLTFMFIGGSPGGTAGGIKTTTVAIMFMTFWANINRRDRILTQSRTIHPRTLYQAVTILLSGAILLFIIIIMLETTQLIPTRDIIFEATSALGTVGLSTGATANLDEIGKVVIMLAMFAGRVGPMTMFMVLSSDRQSPVVRYPEEEIPLT